MDIITAFPNRLPENMDVFELESLLSRHRLDILSMKDDRMEKATNPPHFSRFFHHTLARGFVPDQESFADYLFENASRLSKWTPEKRLFLEARFRRALPSWLRDLHFALYLRKKRPDLEIIINEDLDVKFGVDILLVGEKRSFGLCLFTDTVRSREFRKLKPQRSKPFKGTPLAETTLLELGINLGRAKKVGPYLLYGPTQYQDLVQKIKSELKA